MFLVFFFGIVLLLFFQNVHTLSCPGGYWSNLETKQCVLCAPGTYSASAGQFACTQCVSWFALNSGLNTGWAMSYGESSCEYCPFSEAASILSMDSFLSVNRSLPLTAVIGSKVFFVGGFTGTTASSAIDIYDFSTGQSSSASLKVARYLAGVVELNSLYVLAAGGAQSSDGAPASASVEFYNSVTGALTIGGSLSFARYAMGAACFTNFCLFAGGTNGTTVFSTVDYYNASSNVWSFDNSLSIARCYLSTVTLTTIVASNIALFGGGSAQRGDFISVNSTLAIVDVYLLSSNTWFNFSLSAPRYQMGAAGSGDFAVFAGGYNGSQSVATVDVCSATASSCSVYSLLTSRFGLTATSFGCKVAFAGGASSVGSHVVLLSTIEVADLSNGFSITVFSLLIGSAYLTSATVGNSLVFSGGLSNPSGPAYNFATFMNFCNSNSSANLLCSCKNIPGSYCNIFYGSYYTSCSAGTFSNVTGATTCESCPAGTYAPNSTATMCFSCPGSTFIGATSCAQCSAGSYSSAETSSCVLCSAGTFFPSLGAQTICTNCSAGTYSPNVGATKCFQCLGVISSESGQTTCSNYGFTAQFSNSGNSIFFTFSTVTKVYTNNSGCSSYIPNSNLTAMYCNLSDTSCAAPSNVLSCSWTASNILMLTLPSYAIVPLNFSVFVYYTVYFPLSNQLISNTIESPTIISVPSVIIFAPQQISQCTDLIVDGSSSTGSGGRPFISIKWSLFGNFSSSSDENVTLSTFVTTQNSLAITIDRAQIPTNVLLTFSLYLTNWFGQMSSGNVSVFKSAGIVFPILLGYPIVQSVRRSDTSFLSASSVYEFATDPCISNFSAASTTYLFQWTQILTSSLPVELKSLFSGLFASDILSVPTLFSPSLNVIIPPLTMIAGNLYGFKVNLSVISLNLHSNTTLTSYFVNYAAISCEASSLVSLITGGDQTISLNPNVSNPIFILDGSASYDPDNPTEKNFNYTWLCTNKITGQPCNYGSQYSAANLNVSANYFFGLGLTSTLWSLIVQKYDRSSSSALVAVYITNATFPSVSISVLVNSQTQYASIQSTDRVQFSARLTGISYGYSILWFCSSFNFDLALALTSLSSTELVIGPGYLVAGLTYTFTIVLTSLANYTYSQSTSVTISISSAPSGGTCTSFPTIGFFDTTEFVLSCTDWTDSTASLPLFYSFQVAPSDSPVITLSTFQAINSITTVLPLSSSQGNGSLQVLATIKNRIGAIAQFNFSIVVLVPNLQSSAITALVVSNVNSIALASSINDFNSVSQFMGPVTQLLALQTFSDQLLYAVRVRDYLFNLVNSMVNSSLIQTNDVLTQGITMIAQITSDPYQISPYVQTNAAYFAANNSAKVLAQTTVVMPSQFSNTVLSLLNNLILENQLTPSNFSASAREVDGINLQISNSIFAVARGQIVPSLVGERASNISSSSISLSAQRVELNSVFLNIGNSSVLFPSNLNSTNGPVVSGADLAIFTIQANIYSFSKVAVISSMFGISAFDSSVAATQTSIGQEIVVSGLLVPINFSIPVTSPVNLQNTTLVCQFWNETLGSWSSNGCFLQSQTASLAHCLCNHLTVFSVGSTPVIGLNVITANDVNNFFNWENIKLHPIPLVVICCILFAWLLFSILITIFESGAYYSLPCCVWFFGACCKKRLFNLNGFPAWNRYGFAPITRDILGPIIQSDKLLVDLKKEFEVLRGLTFFQWLTQKFNFSVIRYYSLVFMLILHPWLSVFFS